MKHLTTLAASRTIRAILSLPLFILILMMPSVGKTQHEKSYSYLGPINVKNYAVADMPYSTDMVMAGTQFMSNYTRVHYLRYNGGGNIAGSHVYEFPGEDLVVADIVVGRDNNNAVRAYIICLSQYAQQDRIKILEVETTWGTLMRRWEVQLSTAPDYKHLYPMNALYHNRRLYITGYVSYNPTVGEPSWTTAKKSFLIDFDLITGTIMPAGSQGWDFGYSGDPTACSPWPDFDMGVRLSLIDDNGTPKIHVSGGCNVAICDPSTTPACQCDAGMKYVSGTLSVVATPTATGVTIDHSPRCITKDGIYDPAYRGEYGVGIMKNPNSVTGGYFLVSNYFEKGNNPPAAISNYNEGYAVTYVDDNFNPDHTPGSLNRTEVQYHQMGVYEVLKSYATGGFTLAGLTATLPYGCHSYYYPSLDSYTPFLSEVFPSWSTTVDLRSLNPLYRWKYYSSMAGTGTSNLSNSYNALGGTFTHRLWYTSFAARSTDVTKDVGLAIPIWNSGTGSLNLKLLHLNMRGNFDAASHCDIDSCDVEYRHTIAKVRCTGDQVCPANFTPEVHVLTNPPVDSYAYTNPAKVLCTNVYKHPTTSVEETPPAMPALRVHPNPTQGSINIVLDNIDGRRQVKVYLLAIDGRQVIELHNGNVATLHENPVQLPNAIHGIYFLKVELFGVAIWQEKLIVE